MSFLPPACQYTAQGTLVCTRQTPSRQSGIRQSAGEPSVESFSEQYPPPKVILTSIQQLSTGRYCIPSPKQLAWICNTDDHDAAANNFRYVIHQHPKNPSLSYIELQSKYPDVRGFLRLDTDNIRVKFQLPTQKEREAPEPPPDYAWKVRRIPEHGFITIQSVKTSKYLTSSKAGTALSCSAANDNGSDTRFSISFPSTSPDLADNSCMSDFIKAANQIHMLAAQYCAPKT